jgi:squalene-hopene/tetraprenyl-beta-curcumene cyclase
MTKALTVAKVDQITLKNGQAVNWRTVLAQKLIDLQRPDGSWYNDNGRWWEKDPTLVTAYVVLSLDMLYGRL